MSFFSALAGNALGGYFAYKQNKKAAKALRRAGDQANDFTTNTYNDALGYYDQGFNKASSYLDPYIQSGQASSRLYDNAIGVNGSAAQESYYDQFQNDPGFQSAVDYSNDQIERNYANRGGVNSGRALIALNDNAHKHQYGAFQNRLDRFDRGRTLGFNAARGQADLAFNANANKARATTNYGNAISSNILGAAGSQAQSYANSANILGSTLSNASYYGGFNQGQNSGVSPANSWVNPDIAAVRDVNGASLGRKNNSPQLGSSFLNSLNDLRYKF